MTTGTDLELATRVHEDGGRRVAQLDDAWEIWGPNGGYLAAIALRAAGTVAQIAQPASFYCHFLSSPTFAEVELEVSMLRQGRRSESLAVNMTQGGKLVLAALVRTAADGPGREHQHLTMPAVPPPAALLNCEQIYPDTPAPFVFWDNIERRPIDQDPADLAGDPTILEWTRFRPTPRFADPFVDAARSLILLDTYGYPAAYRKYPDNDFPAPNLDTSAWFHRPSPDTEWLLIEHECSVAEHGQMGVGGRVWDPDGRLVATGAAQLCCVPGS